MRPSCSYLVCATPRSGSTLFCEDLSNTGLAGQPKEYFEALKKSGLPRRPSEYFESLDNVEIQALLNAYSGGDEDIPLQAGSYANYLEQVIKEGTSPNGVFGAKMMWGYFDDFLSHVREIPGWQTIVTPKLLEDIFPNLHYIWITRKDKVRQAVSLWRAIQTSVWRQEDSFAAYRPYHELIFNREAIEHLLQQITSHEEAWRAYFETNAIQPLTIVYEDFVLSQEETIRVVLNYLDVSIPETFALPNRRMRRQADELSEEWVQRYLQYL